MSVTSVCFDEVWCDANSFAARNIVVRGLGYRWLLLASVFT